MTDRPMATTSGDYGADYYATYSGGIAYEWDNPHWKEFFRDVAQQIVSITQARTALDAGCAKGFLVAALREQGVDAEGIDISEHAIAAAPEPAAGHLRVGSLTEPFDRRYDVITCVEVLEHMDPADAQVAMDVLTQATDRILLSTTPDDFAEPTHVNIRPPYAWAADMARRGFFRRTDLDVGVLSPWAVLFERRAGLTPADVVTLYESPMANAMYELTIKRQEHLNIQRRLDDAQAQLAKQPEPPPPPPLPPGIYGERLLAVTDQIIGLQMELAELRYRYANESEVRETRTRELAHLKSTWTWRIGQAALKPVVAARRGRAYARRQAGRVKRRLTR